MSNTVKEIVSVHSENRMKLVNTFYVQNMQLIIKACGTYIYH